MSSHDIQDEIARLEKLRAETIETARGRVALLDAARARHADALFRQRTRPGEGADRDVAREAETIARIEQAACEDAPLIARFDAEIAHLRSELGPAIEAELAALLGELEAERDRLVSRVLSSADPADQDILEALAAARRVNSLGSDLHGVTGKSRHARRWDGFERLLHWSERARRLTAGVRHPVATPWQARVELLRELRA